MTALVYNDERSSVGTHTELEREYGVAADVAMPVCIPTQERGNEVPRELLVTLAPTVSVQTHNP